MSETSFFGLIFQASLIVQLTIYLLVLMSVISWAMIVQKISVYRRMQHQVDSFEDEFWSGKDLNELYKEVDARAGEDADSVSGAAYVFYSGFKEYQRLGGTQQDTLVGMQRVMRISLAHESSNLSRFLPFLATVASVSPYIGLFGTVWGIMRVFRGLEGVQQVTLAVIGPGIAETLIATGLGLFAAIPAVIAYNSFAVRVESLMQRLETFSEELVSIIQRQSSNEG